jgi:hypothetical protein
VGKTTTYRQVGKKEEMENKDTYLPEQRYPPEFHFQTTICPNPFIINEIARD